MVLAQATVSGEDAVFYLVLLAAFGWWTWIHHAMAARLRDIARESRHQTVLLKRIAEKVYGKRVGELDEPTKQDTAEARRQG